MGNINISSSFNLPIIYNAGVSTDIDDNNDVYFSCDSLPI